jgi:hypothetical protein
MPRHPLVVKLPVAFVDRRMSALQVLLDAAKRAGIGSSGVGAFVASYRLSPDEVRFARLLGERHANLWLYRTHQQRRAGDFAVVDVSSPLPDTRRLFVVEVKLGAPVTDGRGAGNQLTAAHTVRTALSTAGVIGEAVQTELRVGDGRALAARWPEVDP